MTRSSPAVGAVAEIESPFSLGNSRSYANWRAAKLEAYPASIDALRVPVADLHAPSATERAALAACCAVANMAIYASPTANVEDKTLVRDLGRALGLNDLDHNPLADDDSVSALHVVPEKSGRGYIPYTDRRLLWHTDGYYNPDGRRIRSFLLHCVRPAAEGGENELLDHEIAYLLLRDRDPRYIEALMHPEAMTIPANTEDPSKSRSTQTGPVFAIDPQTGKLYMRYTARTRSIVWRQDAATRAALACLQDILASDTPYCFRYRLKAGEGLLCNNVLHNRTAFRDAPHTGATRLIYRARYYNRVLGT